MEYVLDVSKWRCGGDQEMKHGDGHTHMLNKEGFMCCLGQFAKQVGVEDAHLLGNSNPDFTQRSIGGEIPYDYNMIRVNDLRSSILAKQLVSINDSSTSPEHKIKEIKETLKKSGHTLKVINWEDETGSGEETVDVLDTNFMSELMDICKELNCDVNVNGDCLVVLDGETERQGEMTIKQFKEYVETKRAFNKTIHNFI